MVAVGLPGAHDRGVEVDRLKTVEAIAGARARHGVVGGHRVHQAPHHPHHGNRAVAHGQHLADAAGFKPTGHQEGIAAGVKQPGEGVVVGEEDSKTARVAASHLPKGRFQGPIARTQDHKLAVGVGEHPIRHLEQQIHPLLIHQPAHHPHQVGAGIHREAKPLLEGLFVGSPGSQVFDAERGRQAGIGLRVPIGRINAIDDAAQFPAHKIEQAVQMLAVLGGQDLLGVGG